MLPLTPLSSQTHNFSPISPLTSLNRVATVVVAQLLLHSHHCHCSAFSSPPNCHYWFLFFIATDSSSSSLLLLVLLLLCNIGLMIHIFFLYMGLMILFFFFFFFCITGITIHICLMSLGSKFLYVGLMSLDLNLG